MELYRFINAKMAPFPVWFQENLAHDSIHT